MEKQVFHWPKGFDYSLTKLTHSTSKFWIAMGNIESLFLNRKLEKINISHPIYISSMPRSGTTVIAHMLSKHPDTVYHYYYDVALIYAPYLWYIFDKIRSPRSENYLERLFQDRLYVNIKSPEALEEMIWMKFFPNLHNENIANFLDETVSNVAFEKFYRNQIKKLIFLRNQQRYITKANYNSTRIPYILKMFPDAKFVIPIRSPLSHIASLIRQDEKLKKEDAGNLKVKKISEIMGHYEFGLERKWLNLGDQKKLAEINNLYKEKFTAKAWGKYWSMVYSFILDCLEARPNLQSACLFISYEKLCQHSDKMIDKILDHCQLDKMKYSNMREEYIKNLSLPNYYQIKFSQQEIQDIKETTEDTYARLEKYFQ